MLTASIVCPHCGVVELATFGDLVEFGFRQVVEAEVAEKQVDLEAKLSLPNHSTDVLPRNRRSRPLADDLLPVAGLLVCVRCRYPMMATLEMTRVELINHKKELHKIGTGSRANTRFTMSEMRLFPEPPTQPHHPSWPDRVQKLVPDIDRAIQLRLDSSIAIATCRTVIDICMKDLGGEGRDIFGRINHLLAKGIITKPIADWAHKVRLLGRDATHDAEGTEEDAAELLRFIRFFLQAAYELGADIAKELDEPEVPALSSSRGAAE